MAFKAMILVGLVTLLAACGGSGPDSPSRLSLEQMRSWCTEFNDRGEERFADLEETWGNVAASLEWILDELASVSPPEELDEFWEASKRAMEVGHAFTRQKPAGELIQSDEWGAFGSEFIAANSEAVTILNELDGEAYDVATYCGF